MSPSTDRSSSGGAVSLRLDSKREGSLAEHPLALLLVSAADQSATGSLRVERGKVHKVIYVLRGVPTFVDSNLRNETLGAYLVSQGALTDEQLAKGIAHARSKKLKLGQALRGLGLADDATIAAGLHAQLQLKIASALRWRDGRYSFAPGDDFSGRVPNIPTDAVPLVLAALKHFVSEPSLAEELGATLQLTEVGLRFRDQVVAVFGHQLIDCGEHGLSLRDTLRRPGIDFADTCVAVAALRRAGLATLALDSTQPPRPAEQPAAPDAATPAAAQAMPPLMDGLAPPSIPPALGTARPSEANAMARQTCEDLLPEHVNGLASPRPTDDRLEMVAASSSVPNRHTPDSNETPTASYEATSSDQIDLIANTAAGDSAIDLEHLEPPVARARRSNPELELELISNTSPALAELDSGVLDLEDYPVDGEPTTQRPEPANALVAALRKTCEGLHDKTCYELLGVEPGAPANEVEAAYRNLSEQFGHVAVPKAELTEAEERQRTELWRRLEQASEMLLDPHSRRSYDERLRGAQAQPLVGEHEADTFGAELSFQDGQNRLRAGDVEGAVRALRAAIEAHPDQPDYHGQLGWALFLERGRGAAGALAARPCFEQALSIDSDHAGVHEVAARVEIEVREYRAAAEHLSQALVSGPPRLDLFDRLRDALSAVGDYRELERQYRAMIFRLRQGDPTETIALWIDLAYLHQEKLESPKDAQTALEVASRLAPRDPSVQAARASLARAAVPLDEIIEQTRQRLLKAPGDPTPLRQLWEPSRAAGDARLQLDIAALLGAFDLANDDQRQVYRGRRKALARAHGRAGEQLAELRDHADHDAIAAIVAELAPALCDLHPLSLEDLGSGELELLAEIGLPDPFRAVVRYVADQLGTGLPDIYLSTTATTLAPAPTVEKRLLVGQGLLETDDQEAIAFAAARALCSLDEGRRHAFGRNAREIKTGFIAAYSICKESAAIADPGGAIARFRQALAPRIDRARLAAHFERFAGGTLNLSRWIRGVRCSAGRIGMLLCGNPGRAIQLVEHSSTRADLLAFALDPRFRKLRADLGLG